ncbi:hypothetical protein L0337_32090 [candidate division KSB1 bacterium]|nr:hypothetical protein [candidate division KSB1 bacterium]
MLQQRFSPKTAVLGFLCSLLIMASIGLAQEETKIDTVLTNQKTMMTKLDKIYREVEYVDPLASKTAGVEFNPAYLLLASADDQLVISGGLSWFSANRNAEIAFPIFFRDAGKADNDPITFSVDSHYRHFLGRHQGGFYLSASVRYQYLRGREDTDEIPFFSVDTNGDKITLHKFGAGFGIGYRYFSRSGLYWGTSLTVGRYFTGTDKQIQGIDLLNGKGYIDVELLKFGIAF